MTAVLATVVLFAASGNPKDNSTLDLVFDVATLDESTAIGLGSALEAWFTTAGEGASNAISDFVGGAMKPATGDNAEIRFYDLTGHLDGTPHGSPAFALTGLQWDHAGSPSYPTEVGVRASLQASYAGAVEKSGSTRPRARRRGGPFIPWIVIPFTSGGASTTSTEYSTTTGQARPSSSLRTAIAQATLGLVTSGLSVWSRTDATLRAVEQVWVDDAFDTVRKRGVAPTTRTFAA